MLNTRARVPGHTQPKINERILAETARSLRYADRAAAALDAARALRKSWWTLAQGGSTDRATTAYGT